VNAADEQTVEHAIYQVFPSHTNI